MAFLTPLKTGHTRYPPVHSRHAYTTMIPPLLASGAHLPTAQQPVCISLSLTIVATSLPSEKTRISASPYTLSPSSRSPHTSISRDHLSLSSFFREPGLVYWRENRKVRERETFIERFALSAGIRTKTRGLGCNALILTSHSGSFAELAVVTLTPSKSSPPAFPR